jgi:Mrp family chromosome partitioning ATPase
MLATTYRAQVGATRVPSRHLAQAYWFIHHAEESRVVTLIAARGGEGTSTLASELACAAAALGGPDVLLLDAAPAAHCNGRPSLIDTVLAGRPIEDAVELLAPGVDIAWLAAGMALEPKLLGPSGLTEVARAVRARYRLTIVDAPALELGIQGIALAAQSDATVVVVEAERTRPPIVERLVELLRRAGAPVVGTILNKRRLYVPAFVYDRL